ncbi:MAG: site-2 protease family protein [Oscillospiraceae bacterium]|nr:site-2 protease family protein [Oscillospiraceae bacterium]MBR6207546.1 site-2 protease family protein [Oscillospiraceae bacterium]
MNAVTNIWNHLDWTVPLRLILGILPSLICITLHELSHGYVAWRLGDPTAKNAGRLTLNPIRHIDPMGLLMMLVFHFGWAKPVPVNMAYFRRPRRDMALTALAGPAANLLIAIVFLFLYGLLYIPLSGAAHMGWLLETVELTAYISLALMVFNILPISPLDGSKVLYSFLPEESYYKLMRYERYGMLALFALVATGVLGSPLSAATNWVYDKLFVIAQQGFDLYKVLAKL